MDAVFLFVVLTLVIGVILIIYFFFRQKGHTEPDDRTFKFLPADEIGGSHFVKRRVTIIAPDQSREGQPHRLIVDALPLPPDPTEPPPKIKGFESLITSVIHPRVRFADTLETIFEFEPPLTVAINYRKEDTDGIDGREGRSKMCVVTFYPEGEVVRWEKLETVNNTESMTLTASLRTLHPKDPVGMGH